MDRKFDSKIGQFILETYRAKQIFYAPGHPTGMLFTMLLAYLMKHLHIAGFPPEVAAFDVFKTLEVPVHPKVAEVLGISWAFRDRVYRRGNENLTWEAYTRCYIETYG